MNEAGLILKLGYEKANGSLLGPELVTNGDFADWTGDNPDGWVVAGEDGSNYATESDAAGTPTLGGGHCKLVSASSDDIVISKDILTIGKTYEIVVDITARSSGFISIFCGTTQLANLSSVLTYNVVLTCVGNTNFKIASSYGDASDITIDNISVREVGQSIQYKKWLGTSEVLESRVHTFTYEKGFYLPLIDDNKVISSTTTWEKEIQPYGRTPE